jgi:Zn-dependent membrane protease YugP
MMWGWFDPVYLLFVGPAMLVALWAQWRVKSAYAHASRIQAICGASGAQAADTILRANGVDGVRIEPVGGFMSDHYVPGQRVLRLSPDVYEGQSLAALGIAAHESGHALQDAQHYPLLVMRSALVPAASLGGGVSWILLMIGFVLASMNLILIGIAAFSLTVVFQLVNLPVEFNASRRARIALAQTGLITPEEDVHVKKVLDAAALTYVAATLSALLTLLYFLYRSGLLGGRRN